MNVKQTLTLKGVDITPMLTDAIMREQIGNRYDICFQEVGVRCYILARHLVLCARMLCNELKTQSQRSVRLRADHRALQPTSTPSELLAVIQPNHRCLFVQLSFAWNE